MVDIYNDDKLRKSYGSLNLKSGYFKQLPSDTSPSNNNRITVLNSKNNNYGDSPGLIINKLNTQKESNRYNESIQEMNKKLIKDKLIKG
jgi:hypothetical protein